MISPQQKHKSESTDCITTLSTQISCPKIIQGILKVVISSKVYKMATLKVGRIGILELPLDQNNTYEIDLRKSKCIYKVNSSFQPDIKEASYYCKILPNLKKNIIIYFNTLKDLSTFKDYSSLLSITLADFEDDFEIISPLGEGCTSRVSKVISRVTGQRFAVKEMSKYKVCRERILQEVGLLRLVGDHPHIVRLHQVYENDRYFYLVTDLLQGILPPISDPTLRRRVVRQVLEAMLCLKDQGYIHGDIKPHNILYNEECQSISLCDLGSSVFLKNECRNKRNNGRINKGQLQLEASKSQSQSKQLHSPYRKESEEIEDSWLYINDDQQEYRRQGTPGYIAPELQGFEGGLPISQKGSTTKKGEDPLFKGDMYSLGRVIFYMMNFTFQHSSVLDLEDKVEQDFLEGILKLRPVERMGIEDALNHPYLKKADEINILEEDEEDEEEELYLQTCENLEGEEKGEGDISSMYLPLTSKIEMVKSWNFKNPFSVASGKISSGNSSSRSQQRRFYLIEK